MLEATLDVPVASSVADHALKTPAIPDSAPPRPGVTAGRVVTTRLVGGPVVALGVFLLLGWGHVVTVGDLALGAALYLFTGFGIAVGFHRLSPTAASERTAS